MYMYICIIFKAAVSGGAW